MNSRRKTILSILWVVLGLVLLVLGISGTLDAYWSGMGGGFLAVGALQLHRFWRISKDPEYRERKEVEMSDERNRFIQGKAWHWAATLFVIIAGIGCIVFRVMGQELLSLAASWAVCLLVALYWISWMVLRKRY